MNHEALTCFRQPLSCYKGPPPSINPNQAGDKLLEVNPPCQGRARRCGVQEGFIAARTEGRRRHSQADVLRKSSQAVDLVFAPSSGVFRGSLRGGEVRGCWGGGRCENNDQAELGVVPSLSFLPIGGWFGGLDVRGVPFSPKMFS